MHLILENWKRYLEEELQVVAGGNEETTAPDGYSRDITIKGYVFPNDDLIDVHVIDSQQGEIGFESFKLYQGPLDFMPLLIEYLRDSLGIEIDKHIFKFVLDDQHAEESKIYGTGSGAMAEFANDIFATG